MDEIGKRLLPGRLPGTMRDSRDDRPVAVIEDRYGGTYSGGGWLAISVADHIENGAYRVVRCLEGGPSDSDVEAREFWESPPPWIAVGRSPNEAVEALRAKIRAQHGLEVLAELDQRIADGAADLAAGRLRSINEVRAAMRERFGPGSGAPS